MPHMRRSPPGLFWSETHQASAGACLMEFRCWKGSHRVRGTDRHCSAARTRLPRVVVMEEGTDKCK